MTLHDDPAPDHIAHWAEKGKIVLDGIVSENPRVSEDRTSLVLEASRVSGEGFSRGVSGKILLSVGENTRLFKVGDLIRTETRLRHPRSFGNPGAFDYERYLRLQGIRVRGFVNDPRKIVLIREGQGDPMRQALEQFRTRIRDRIRSQAPFPEGTLIQAMTLGEQSEIPRAIQDRFNRTGTSHIIAISGFNVGIIALIAFFLIRTLLKTSETLLLRFNIQKLSALFAFAPVVFYAFVAGLGMSTVRALLMTLALLITILMGRGRDLFNTLALAAFVILVVSPAALFDISFQLSFTAVASILLFMPGITERLTAWKNRAEGRPARLGRRITADLLLFVAVSAACTLGTLPFIVYYFNRISNITLVANLLLVPILGFVVLPFSMLLILVAPLSDSLSALLIDITTVLTRLCLDLNDWLAALPGSSSIITTPTIPELTAYYVILISAALLLGLPGRTSGDTPHLPDPAEGSGRDGAGRDLPGRRCRLASPETSEPGHVARHLPQCGPRQLRPRRIPRRKTDAGRRRRFLRRPLRCGPLRRRPLPLARAHRDHRHDRPDPPPPGPCERTSLHFGQFRREGSMDKRRRDPRRLGRPPWWKR